MLPHMVQRSPDGARNKGARYARGACAAVVAVFATAACTSIPEDTPAPHFCERVQTMALWFAGNAAPDCKEPKVIATDVVAKHANRDLAEELWTIDACGKPLSYVVTYPEREPGYTSGFRLKPKP